MVRDLWPPEDGEGPPGNTGTSGAGREGKMRFFGVLGGPLSPRWRLWPSEVCAGP